MKVSPFTISYTYKNAYRINSEDGTQQSHTIQADKPQTFDDLVRALEHQKIDFDKKSVFLYQPESNSYLLLTSETNLVALFTDRDEIKLRLCRICSEECTLRYNTMQKVLEETQRMVEAMQKQFKEMERQMTTKIVPDSKKEFGNSQLDVAIIYAEPLNLRKENFSMPVETLDYETECYKIVKDLEIANINISIQIEIGTRENFLQIIQKGPKILHVICHGVYIKERKDYFLCFEDEKGNTDLVSSSELKAWFKNCNFETKLVFTNACHFEQVARVFYDAGIPCVVAVQSNYAIDDQAAKEFAKSFYKSILVRGLTPYDAFVTARKTLRSAYSSCCCTHGHKSTCVWYKKYFQEDSTNAHNHHTPDCKCEKRDIQEHDPFCMWADEFLTSIDKCMVEGGNCIQTCCCSPELLHSEINKFIMMPEGYNHSIVLEARQGPPQIKSHDKFLKPDFPVNQVVSRNKELFSLLDDLLAGSIRSMVLSGEPGSGKSTLVKRLANYLNIRSHFHDRLCMIEMRGIRSIDQLKSELASKILNPYEIYDFTDLNGLLEIIKHKEILIILEDCDTFIAKFHNSFVALIDNILGKTSKLKFLFTVSKEISKENRPECFHVYKTINTNIKIEEALKIINQIAPPEYMTKAKGQLALGFNQPTYYKLQDIYWVAHELRKNKGGLVETIKKRRNMNSEAGDKEGELFSNISKSLE